VIQVGKPVVSIREKSDVLFKCSWVPRRIRTDCVKVLKEWMFRPNKVAGHSGSSDTEPFVHMNKTANLTPAQEVIVWILVNTEHKSREHVSRPNKSIVRFPFTLLLPLRFLALQTLLLVNIDGIMLCRRNANTRSLLQKMSAFRFFHGHGDEVGALPTEIACTVDSAHLDLSVDELGKKERELISYY
jgi:hypothetical protein